MKDEDVAKLLRGLEDKVDTLMKEVEALEKAVADVDRLARTKLPAKKS